MSSIQRRLGLGLFAAAVVIGVSFTQLGLWLFENGMRQYLKNTLMGEAEGLLVAIVRGPSGVQLDQRRIHPAYERPFAGRYFVIEMDGQRWRSRSLWDTQLQPPARPGLADALGDGPGNQRLLVYREDFRKLDRAFTITVAQDYTPLLERFQHMRWLGLGLGALGLVLLVLFQQLTVRRSLRPLERVRRQVAQLQQGRRAELARDVPEELQPLVDQVNRLLAHTEDNLKRSRHALGDLGHALKTPLAVLVSLSAREEWRSHPELQRTFADQLSQIQARLSRELGRARLAGEALPGAYFDCAAELPALFDTLQMIHGTALDLRWHADEALRLPWDREDLIELLGNLLDNACKWASGCVRLEIRATDGGYRLEVDDDGPGIAPEARQRVLTRGERLDEQTAGHGLGLGIVRDIVEACEGQLVLEQSPLGGLRARIDLPARACASRWQ